MGNQTRDEGEYGRKFTEEDAYAAFERIDEPLVRTIQIADEIGSGRETARKLLIELHKDGRINRHKPARINLWWRDTDEPPERRLERLSRELDEEIIVGNVAYRNGEKRLLDSDEDDDDQ